MLNKILKIRNYAINEEYKTSLLYYLEKEAENYINKPASSLLDGYLLCLQTIRAIPAKVERLKK